MTNACSGSTRRGRCAEAHGMTHHVASQRPVGGISLVEFVVLIAVLQALGALGIDAMLPNIPAIGEALGVADENRRQLIITAYLLGLGGSQLIYGPLSDRFGRRPVLAVGLCLYVGFSLLAAFAPTFELLLAARVLQGVGAASTRSVPISVVRDRYAGREMARVMSLTSIVFMAAPIVAPSLGQLVLMYASWPGSSPCWPPSAWWRWSGRCCACPRPCTRRTGCRSSRADRERLRHRGPQPHRALLHPRSDLPVRRPAGLHQLVAAGVRRCPRRG